MKTTKGFQEYAVRELALNRELFRQMLTDVPRAEYLWKPRPESWCMLEILCHLHDEEREDFRARVKHVLEGREGPPPSIDPQGWVKARDYLGQDFESMLKMFLEERDKSLAWLGSLEDPSWDNVYVHPKLGAFSARKFLANWLAHDLLHLRQITRLRYDYLAVQSGEDLGYAGTWK